MQLTFSTFLTFLTSNLGGRGGGRLVLRSLSFDTLDNSREKRQVLKGVSKGCRPPKTQDLTLLTLLTRRIWASSRRRSSSCRAAGSGGRAAAGGVERRRGGKSARCQASKASKASKVSNLAFLKGQSPCRCIMAFDSFHTSCQKCQMASHSLYYRGPAPPP